MYTKIEIIIIIICKYLGGMVHGLVCFDFYKLIIHMYMPKAFSAYRVLKS